MTRMDVSHNPDALRKRYEDEMDRMRSNIEVAMVTLMDSMDEEAIVDRIVRECMFGPVEANLVEFLHFISACPPPPPLYGYNGPAHTFADVKLKSKLGMTYRTRVTRYEEDKDHNDTVPRLAQSDMNSSRGEASVYFMRLMGGVCYSIVMNVKTQPWASAYSGYTCYSL